MPRPPDKPKKPKKPKKKMAAVVVALDGPFGTGTRHDSLDTNTNTGHWGGSGGAPAANPQNRYQGTNAVDKKVNQTGATPPSVGIDFDPGAGAVDMSTRRYRLWLAKIYVTDFGDLNATYGVKLGIGSSNAAYYEYNAAGSGANRGVFATYPPQGGYLLAVIDPLLAAFWENTVGTPDLTAVDWMGVQALFVAGGGKAENLAFDAIDTGSGLLLTRGDGADPDGTYESFSDNDQGNSTNRWGFATSPGPGSVELRGIHQIGNVAVATVFTDPGNAVAFPDGYYIGGDLGVWINLENSGTIVTDPAAVIGQGDIDTDADSRPDLVVVGTAGTATLDGRSSTKHRRIQLNNAVSAENMAIKNSGQIDPTNGDYGGYQTLDGTGDYIDTSAAVAYLSTTTSDHTLVMRVAADDWTPSATEVLFDWASNPGGSGDRIALRLNTSGNLEHIVESAGSTTTFTSSVAVPGVAGQWFWLRVDYDGAGNVDFYYSHESDNAVPQDMPWTALGTQQSGTSRLYGLITAVAVIGANGSGTSEFAGDVAYASIWDGLAFGADLQILLADWRTGPDFTGSPAARADGIQSVNWEENGDPVYTLGGNNTTAADLDGTAVADSTSYAALRWDVNADPNGELDNMTFDMGIGSGHALEFGKNTPSTITLTNLTVIGHSASAENVESAIYNNSGKHLTINLIGLTGTVTVRNGVGASTTLVVSPVTLQLHAIDGQGFTDVASARAFVLAGDVGPLPYKASVTITRVTTTATVAHTAHGLSNGDKVFIVGADQNEYNGTKTISNVSANAYDFTVSGSPTTPATGTITSTAVIIDELTTAGGIADDTRSYSADQDIDQVRSWIRKGSAADDPKYRTAPVAGTIDKDAGLSVVVQMQQDE